MHLIGVDRVSFREEIPEVFKSTECSPIDSTVHDLLREILSSLGAGLLLAILFNAPLGFLLWKASRLRRQYRVAGGLPLKELSFRPPGESLRARIDRLIDTQLSEIIALLAAAIVAVLIVTAGPDPWQLPLFAVAFLVVGATGIWAIPRLLRTTRQIWECRLAFDGERSVGEELNQLMYSGYHVFHDLPCERFNIDHVIVGPAGVFAIETKTLQCAHSPSPAESRVRYDGEKLAWPHHSDSAPVDQALFNARSLGHWLSCVTDTTIRVQPIVAVPGWTVQGDSLQADVWVLNPKDIRAIVTGSDQSALDPSVLQQITAHLSDRSGIGRAACPHPS